MPCVLKQDREGWDQEREAVGLQWSVPQLFLVLHFEGRRFNGVQSLLEEMHDVLASVRHTLTLPCDALEVNGSQNGRYKRQDLFEDGSLLDGFGGRLRLSREDLQEGPGRGGLLSVEVDVEGLLAVVGIFHQPAEHPGGT